MKTTCLKTADLKPRFLLVDLKGLSMGRVASLIANLLRGKDRIDYTPHMPCGAHVICINNKDIVLTGRKRKQKTYIHHTGWMGGLKELSFRQVSEKDATFPLKKAVERMVPCNKTRRLLMSRLHIFQDENHTYGHLNPVRCN